MIHAILVGGQIKRVAGTPLDAEEYIVKRKAEGRAAAYLFGATSESEFEQKKQEEIDRSGAEWHS